MKTLAKILPKPGTLRDVPNYNGEYCLPENVRGVFVRGKFYELGGTPYLALKILEEAPDRILSFIPQPDAFSGAPRRNLR